MTDKSAEEPLLSDTMESTQIQTPTSPVESNSSLRPAQEVMKEEDEDTIIAQYTQACQAGDILTVKELIEGGIVDINNDVDRANVSGLHWAAINNRVSIVKYLISKGAAVDREGGELNATPLHWACRYGLVYIVDYLLKEGADPNKVDSQGFNALHLAVHSSNVMLVIYMLICAPEVDIDSVDPNDRTAIHWAAYQGDSLSVDVLLKFKASVRKVDKQGFIPLHWALIRGQKECLKRLIEEGSDITAKTNDGKDSFVIAGDMNCTQNLTDALFEAGYDCTGAPLKKLIAEKWAKLFCFFLPYLIVGLCLKIAASQHIVITLSSFIVIYLCSNFLLRKVLLPSFILSSSPIIKSPFLSGIFSASAFWTLLNWAFVILPYTATEAPFVNLLFIVFFGVTIYYFQRAMFKDPGIIERPQSDQEIQETIYELLQEGKYDANHFCVNTFIRKPLRSKYSYFHKKCVARFDHYCPWIYNDVGLRNHKAFMFFVIALELAVGSFLFLVTEYFDELDDDNLSCVILDGDLCAAWTYSRFSFLLSLWCLVQLTWLTFLLFSQLFQISKGVTTIELSNLTKGNNDANQYYSSTPAELLDNDDVPVVSPGTHRHRNPLSTFYMLTGLDQFIIAVKQSIGIQGHTSIGEIPFDYGVKQNLIDFWFASGDDHLKIRNLLKFPVKGEANLGGQTVDYFKLYKIPPKKIHFVEEV